MRVDVRACLSDSGQQLIFFLGPYSLKTGKERTSDFPSQALLCVASSRLSSTAVCNRRQRSRNDVTRRGDLGMSEPLQTANSRDNEAFNLQIKRNMNIQSFAF